MLSSISIRRERVRSANQIITAIMLLVAATCLHAQEAPAPKTEKPVGLPYVYTEWEHFGTEQGLPNDHIFAVKADGPYVWIGTEDGLARYDKRSKKFKSWGEEDGLPWRVVSGIDVDPKTGDVWLALFGGGLARFSAGRFDHFHQLNSGVVNDVVYGVAIQDDHVWAATTAGASRYNTVTGEWTIYNEKNAPMEEIWNYGVSCSEDKVYLSVWGSGILEFDIKTERWKDYLDPDGEMEIDLYRDDGIVHVITTSNSYADGILWISTYFGMSRYDGRYWRGYYAKETGLPSDFGNAVTGRSADEAWFATDSGIGAVTHFDSDTWVTYTIDAKTERGKAVVQRGKEVVKTYDLDRAIPHNHALAVEFDGDDVWVGTAQGLARGVGKGYYEGVKEK
jgi:ligand-binding sensor domain-containing protein